MFDHPENTVTVRVTLDQSTLCRAARLGGLPIALDEKLIEKADGSMELVQFFAKRGITHAIHDSFDRLYPSHYPDDLTEETSEQPWSMEANNCSYQWDAQWTGTVTW